MIRSSNDEINFPHKLLLTNIQVAKIRKAFENGSSADIKLSKTRLSKIIQSRIPCAMLHAGKEALKKV